MPVSRTRRAARAPLALVLAAVAAALGATAAGAAPARALATAPVSTTSPAIAGASQVGSTLTATTGSWTGDSPISYSFTWLRCDAGGSTCAAIAGATSQSYLVAVADLGQRLRVSVVALNGAGAGGAVSATTSAIASAPSAPTSSVAPSVSGSAREGQQLTASTGTWSGTGTIAYTYQWKRCDASGQSCVDASNVIAQNTIVLAAADVGKTIRAVVIATTTAGAASSTSAPTPIVVAANAPAVTALPAITGLAREGEALTASTGAWQGSGLTFKFQWRRCDTAGENCTDASAQIAQNGVTLVSADTGKTIRVVVTATGSGGTATATSDPTGVVVKRDAPVNTALPAVTGTAREGQQLTVSTGTWNGAGTISYQYQWQRCDTSGQSCVDASNVISQSSVTLAAADVGKTIRGRVIATNAAGSASASTVATAVVLAANAPVPAGSDGLPTGNGPFQVAQIAAPNRLVVKAFAATPARIASRAVSVLTVTVTDAKGRPVQGAVVTVTPLPLIWAKGGSAPTGPDGKAAVAIRPTAKLPLAKGNLPLLIKATKPQDDATLPVTGFRVVQLRVG